MPYVEPDTRRLITRLGQTPTTAGELNFVLTMVVLDYMREHGVSYQTLNDISGAMTECLAEFRRRVVVPYEDVKAHLNGDVYDVAVQQLAEALKKAVDERHA